MLNGIHFLLTYTCLFECDHCFLYCSPSMEGTFTLQKLRKTYDEIEKIESVEWIYFEGGESFLFYPLLLEGVRMARELGLNVGIVTNAYWATSVEDAVLWLEPLNRLGIADLSVSDDLFHSGDEEENSAKLAIAAAKKLGMPVDSICIERPVLEAETGESRERGEPVVGGGVVFRGRAVEKLIDGLPGQSGARYTECPYEDLVDPKRVHIDPFGNVHLCQGLIIGNMWKTPLSEIIRDYKTDAHPICKPVHEGGPARLAEVFEFPAEGNYVTACHFCYQVRLSLIDRFPDFLGPRSVYGLSEEENSD